MTDNDHTENGIMELESTISNPRVGEQAQTNVILTVSQPLTVTEEIESKDCRMKKDNLQSNKAIDRDWTGNTAAAASLSMKHEFVYMA